MADSKKLIDLFQSKGLLFPTSSKEVEEFEKFNIISDKKTSDWDAPENILKRGMQKLEHIEDINSKSLNNDIEELKMVARKGSNLPPHIIDKMKAKHKKDDK